VVTSLLHRAVEGPFADDRTSVFPPFNVVVGGGRGAGGCVGGPALALAPFPVPGGSSLFALLRVACTAAGSRAAVGGRRPEDAHARWRGRPPGVTHRLFAGFRQCGSFVEVCAVGCVLSWGRGLVLVRGGGACRAVGGGLRSGVALVDVRLDVVTLPPRSSRRRWRVVGWVGIMLDVIGGEESALWEGCYPAFTLASTCGANRAS
jgi:hypothetical protein